MSRRRPIIGVTGVVSLLLVLSPGVYAEDAVPVELGTTGLYLPNHAMSQDKHYLEQDEDLLGRIACLLQDMDALLLQLHALPPERMGAGEASPATAEELPQLIAIALEHNPALEPLRSQMAIDGALARQVGAKPDPRVNFGMQAVPLPQFELADQAMTQIALGWSQEFISYGKRGLRRQIASMDADITELKLSSAELELIDSISMQYFDLVSTRARRDVLEQNRELLSLLLSFAERKYALGLTPQAQVISAQTKLTMLEQRALELDKLLARQQVTLYGTLGRPEGFDPADLVLRAEYSVPALVELNEDELLVEMLARRPDMQRFSVQQRQQGMRLELAQREYRPDYTVSAQYGIRWGKRDFFSVNVAVPVFTHKAERQDAKVQEQAARQDMLEQQQAALESELATKLGLLQVDLDRIYELAALYRTALVPQARLALDSMIAGYAANQTGLDELLLAQDTLLSYELALEELSIDYLAALTQLQIATADAFDPVPYLTQEADGVNAIRAPVVIPLDAEEHLADEERTQLEGLFFEAGKLTGGTYSVPPIKAGLIESLNLPQPGDVEYARLAALLAGSVQGEAWMLVRDGTLSSASGSEADSAGRAFYAPFAPRSIASGDVHGEEGEELDND